MKNLNMKSTIGANKNGFSFVETLLMLFILGLVVFLGLNVVNRQNDSSKTENDPASSQPAEINNEQDLQQTENALDEINLDELDTSELDAAEADLL